MNFMIILKKKFPQMIIWNFRKMNINFYFNNNRQKIRDKK